MHLDWIRFNQFKIQLDRAGGLNCRIVSDSMCPLIQVGDEVRVEPLGEPSQLKRFDLLVFFNDGRLFCHYLWHRNELPVQPGWITRSLKDPLRNDLPISASHILGRVTEKQLPTWTKLKILLWNLARRTL